MPSEGVNPAPDFWNWREHLSNLAHDFQLGHRYDRLAMRAVDTRRYAGQPSLTSTEEQTRNGNITQHSREMLGWLWQQIHIMSRMSHNDDWRAFREWLRPWIEGYCACFDARGALDRIHVGHDFLVWEKSLRLHERFIPDFQRVPVRRYQSAGRAARNRRRVRIGPAELRQRRGLLRQLRCRYHPRRLAGRAC